jgi:hypothetical protein
VVGDRFDVEIFCSDLRVSREYGFVVGLGIFLMLRFPVLVLVLFDETQVRRLRIWLDSKLQNSTPPFNSPFNSRQSLCV